MRKAGTWLVIMQQHDPHLTDIDFFRRVDHPSEGKIKLTSPPVNFSETPATISRLPPLLGEHNEDVLKEIGYTDEEISQFYKNQIIGRLDNGH